MKRLRHIREPEQSSESGQGWSVFKLILIELDVKKRIQIELPPASVELLSMIPNFVNIYKICLSWWFLTRSLPPRGWSANCNGTPAESLWQSERTNVYKFYNKLRSILQACLARMQTDALSAGLTRCCSIGQNSVPAAIKEAERGECRTISRRNDLVRLIETQFTWESILILEFKVWFRLPEHREF